jgi:CubicO group peptidase (beta-lactamase class C family)
MDGRVVYTKGHGLADATAGVPAGDDTLWYVASTSKSFTGFAIALLVHQGAMRLTDPIGAVLPGVRWHPAVRPQELTLARFLSHTHDLNDNAIVSSAAFTGAIPEASWPSLLRLAAPRAEHGLVYSNFGYNVAAMAIDAVRPEGWRAFLEQNVYRPAGLSRTFARVSGLDGRQIARPHRLRGHGGFATDPFYKTDATMNSAGGHLASLNDLARWTVVQMDEGRIDGRQVYPREAVALSQRLIATHTVSQSRRFAYFDRAGWAAGWDIGSYEGEPMISRFGGYHSFRSHLSFLPRRRVGVVAITNGGVGTVTDALAALAYDLEAGVVDAGARAEERYQQLKARVRSSAQQAAQNEVDRAARQQLPLDRPLSDFAGHYSEPSFGDVIFTVRDGTLDYRWGAVYGPAGVHDAARREWRIEIAGADQLVRFEFDGPGPARSISLQGVTFLRK